MLTPPTTDDTAIWNVWMAAFHAPTLAIADELGVFARLAERPLAAADLASTLGIEVRATEALAGVLASLGFLAHAGGAFHLTDVARTYLVPGAPYYWGGMLRRIRENPLDCAKLVAALRRGTAAADAALTQMWAQAIPPPAALVAFTHAMHAHSFSLAMRTIRGFDLGTRLLDVAGGSGSYSIAAAIQRSDLAATVLDLPPVCDVAREYAVAHGVGDRVSTAAADMFAGGWPTGHDRILMADIFHDWDDARCAVLAAHAFAALAPGGKLLLHEMLLSDDKTGPAAAAAYSMIMVFVTQGRQRSAPELCALLAGAGFTDIALHPTAGGYMIVEGTRP